MKFLLTLITVLALLGINFCNSDLNAQPDYGVLYNSLDARTTLIMKIGPPKLAECASFDCNQKVPGSSPHKYQSGAPVGAVFGTYKGCDSNTSKYHFLFTDPKCGECLVYIEDKPNKWHTQMGVYRVSDAGTLLPKSRGVEKIDSLKLINDELLIIINDIQDSLNVMYSNLLSVPEPEYVATYNLEINKIIALENYMDDFENLRSSIIQYNAIILELIKEE